MEAEARGEGETLARHRKALLELAKKRNLHITHIHSEVVSGETIASRPVMQQLLTEVEQGMWTGVLVMEVERLARGDTADQGLVAQTFKYSETKIITPHKTYDPDNEFDEEYFEFGLFMSRREYKTINRRLQQGRIASVKEGKYLGSIAPFGYRRKKLENQKGYTLEIDPEQAEIVKLIFQWYTKGEIVDGEAHLLGVSMIAGKLNELKISPAKSDIWVTSTILDMLRNPVYIGMIRWNWRKTTKKMEDGQIVKSRPRSSEEECILVEGLHKPIISLKTWEIAQKYLSVNSARVPTRGTKVKNPLCGIIICGVCGRRMVRRPYKKGPDALMCPIPGCKNVSSKLEIVEDRLLTALTDWLIDLKIKWEKDEPTPTTSKKLVLEKSLENLQKELHNLENQTGRIHDLLEQGIYNVDTFLDRSKLLNEKIRETREAINKINEDIRIEEAQEDNLNTLIPKLEKVLEMYTKTDDLDLKNQLLKSILGKVEYYRSKGGRWHNPEDFELILFPTVK